MGNQDYKDGFDAGRQSVLEESDTVQIKTGARMVLQAPPTLDRDQVIRIVAESRGLDEVALRLALRRMEQTGVRW